MEKREKRLFSRAGFFSKISIFLAMWNLYQIRQVVLKQAINLTKSKNKGVIRAASLGVAGGYGLALFLVWQIPFITFELANDLRRGANLAVLGWTLPPSIIQPQIYDLIKGDMESEGF